MAHTNTHTRTHTYTHYTVITRGYWYIWCVCVCVHWIQTRTLATHSLQFPDQATIKTPTTQHGLHYCRLPATTERCPDPHSICSWTAGLANKLPQRMEAGGRLSYWLICRVIGWEPLKQPKDINISHPVGRRGKFPRSDKLLTGCPPSDGLLSDKLVNILCRDFSAGQEGARCEVRGGAGHESRKVEVGQEEEEKKVYQSESREVLPTCPADCPAGVLVLVNRDGFSLVGK